jgi:hypothetical protein
MLAVSQKPELLLEFDMVGNSLIDGFPHRPGAMETRHKDASARAVNAFLKEPGDDSERVAMRATITPVGVDRGLSVFPDLMHWRRVPFDEPCLGIIGMWRLGGGANPHFALALGETMMRVGQRHLAWSAYQRAIREAGRFSANPEIRAKFIEHCKTRQKGFGFTDAEIEELEGRFDVELNTGQSYHRAYQKYEEDQIAAGKDIDDPHFYDVFNAQHGNIATPVGDADFLAVQERHCRQWPRGCSRSGYCCSPLDCFWFAGSGGDCHGNPREHFSPSRSPLK